MSASSSSQIAGHLPAFSDLFLRGALWRRIQQAINPTVNVAKGLDCFLRPFPMKYDPDWCITLNEPKLKPGVKIPCPLDIPDCPNDTMTRLYTEEHPGQFNVGVSDRASWRYARADLLH